MSCSIVFIQWGGESERESVSWPEDTIAGSSTVRSGAPLLLHPAQQQQIIRISDIIIKKCLCGLTSCTLKHLESYIICIEVTLLKQIHGIEY